MFWGSTHQKPYNESPPLKKLVLTELNHLELGETHYGQYLKLKLVSECVKLVGIQITCQDHVGTQILVSIYNFDTKDTPLNKIFFKGKIMYVKEPFFKIAMDGQQNIRIDNPRDIIFENHPEAQHLSNSSQKPNTDYQDEIFRQDGLRLMKDKHYIQAYIKYSQALELTKNMTYIAKFLLNKAIVCEKINLPQQYLSTVMSVLKLTPHDPKALYHQIKALILNGHNTKAMKLLKQKESLFDKQTIEAVHKFYKLINDAKEGKINWYQALNNQQIGVYSFKDIKFKNSYERGLFACRDLKPGTLLWVERALLTMQNKSEQNFNMNDINTNQTNLNIAIGKMLKLSEQFKIHYNTFTQRIMTKYQKAFAQNQYFSEQEMLHDMNIKSIKQFERNWFNMNTFDDFFEEDNKKMKKNFRLGLFNLISLVNHSCEQNCQRFTIDDRMVLFTKKQIKAGEQIFVSFKKDINYSQRMWQLDSFQMDCWCQLCLQQSYEVKKGKNHPNPRSEGLKQLRIFNSFGKSSFANKQELFNYYDIPSIVVMLKKGKDLKLAVKMLRRILPMKEEQAIEILERYVPKK